MATGAHHYQQAEKLLELAARWENVIVDDLADYSSIDSARRAAQAHATLAMAAAVIEPTVQSLARGEGTDERVITEWAEAVSG